MTVSTEATAWAERLCPCIPTPFGCAFWKASMGHHDGCPHKYRPDIASALQQLMDERDALRVALKWALPLAELAVDTHRMERIRCGHSDIVGTYKDGESWVGIWQSEVDDIEFARTALSPKEPQS